MRLPAKADLRARGAAEVAVAVVADRHVGAQVRQRLELRLRVHRGHAARPLVDRRDAPAGREDVAARRARRSNAARATRAASRPERERDRPSGVRAKPRAALPFTPSVVPARAAHLAVDGGERSAASASGVLGPNGLITPESRTGSSAIPAPSPACTGRARRHVVLDGDARVPVRRCARRRRRPRAPARTGARSSRPSSAERHSTLTGCDGSPPATRRTRRDSTATKVRAGTACRRAWCAGDRRGRQAEDELVVRERASTNARTSGVTSRSPCRRVTRRRRAWIGFMSAACRSPAGVGNDAGGAHAGLAGDGAGDAGDVDVRGRGRADVARSGRECRPCARRADRARPARRRPARRSCRTPARDRRARRSRRQRRARLVSAAGLRHAGVRGRLDALHVRARDEVDDAADRIGAVHRGCAVLQNLDALDRRERNRVEVHARAVEGVVRDPAPVEQHERACVARGRAATRRRSRGCDVSPSACASA